MNSAGNDHPTAIPTGVFRTLDGHINIAASGGAIWERFCRALHAEELAQKPEYQNAKARSQNRKALNAEINAYTEKKNSAEWIEIFNEAGVPCGPIYTIDKMFSDPQVEHLGIVQPMKRPDGSTTAVVGQPMTLSRTKSRIATPTPALGGHTDEVLKEFGFTPKEIAALRKANAL